MLGFRLYGHPYEYIQLLYFTETQFADSVLRIFEIQEDGRIALDQLYPAMLPHF